MWSQKAQRSKLLGGAIAANLEATLGEQSLHTSYRESGKIGMVGKWQEADGGQSTTWDCQEAAAVFEMCPEHGSSSGLSHRINNDDEELERFGWGTLL